MRLVKRILSLLALLLATTAAPAANTTVRLLLSHDVVKAGETIWAGVEFRIPGRWHIYWRNSGDSGGPTEIEWTLPAGVTAGEPHWPVAEEFVTTGFTTFVYHKEAIVLVPLTFAPSVTGASPVEIVAKATWLECEEGVCLPPTRRTMTTPITVGAEAKPSKDAARLEAAKLKLPQPKPASFAHATWEPESATNTRPFVVEWKPGPLAKHVAFLPLPDGKFPINAASETVSLDATKARVRKQVEKAGGWPTEVAGVLVERDGQGQVLASHEVKLPLATAAATGATTASTTGTGQPTRSLFVWLGMAFLGGLILNLMPCVLPVIALKIFGFVAQSHEAPARVRQLGLIYGLGVLCSFLVLAGFVIAVQSAGRAATWGMQFGNPFFLVGLVVLMTLVALNFFGLFEISLGGGALDQAATLAGREGKSGAFFNGVLATVLATPCTAPFLAPALGFAFAQPAQVIVLMFSAVAVGLAAPYVVLSFQPGWLKFLPKPGAWMEKFKISMGFPMLATALWLLSVVSRHYGTDGILWVGMFLIFVAVAAWIWGEFVQRGSQRKGLAMAMAAVFFFGGYAFTLESQLEWRDREKAAFKIGAGAGLELELGGIQWQKWSRIAVTQARSEGRPVFVDFTSATCLNCKVNKKTSIEIPSVRAKLKEINAVSLLGDYTLVPDDITEELKRYGRAGVPLVLVYSKDATKEAVVLPALLTPSIVLEALDAAAK